MRLGLVTLEIGVLIVALGLLLADLWAPPRWRRAMGLLAAAALVGILGASYAYPGDRTGLALAGMYLFDPFAFFCKRFFLVAAALVLVLAAESASTQERGAIEFQSLVLFALIGMMVAASAQHFAVLFVALELITVTFYVLTAFERRRLASLEAGAKYLVLGALSSAILIYGIALIYGVSGTLAFADLARLSSSLSQRPLFLMGLLMVLAGLGFKIAVVPFQLWAPDVYQGAPVPTVAFLAVGSKAAGFVLLMRLIQTVVPEVALHWEKLLVAMAGLSILYGNLCALPQKSLKRLLGYSSIAQAGYLLMGVTVLSQAGSTAVLYYLAGYLFTMLGALTVLAVVLLRSETDDIEGLAGLSQRSPLLAAVMALAMISLAGVPPLAGFFGKFLLIKAVLEQGQISPIYYALAAVAILGVVISLYYYFGVIRKIYWPAEASDLSPLRVGWVSRALLLVCAAGMLLLGLVPGPVLRMAAVAAKSL